MVDTMTFRLAISATFGDWALATTTADSDAVDDKALGGTVTQTASLVRSGRTGSPVDTVELAVLPAPNSQQKAKNIALFLAVQLLHILVGPHLMATCPKENFSFRSLLYCLN